MTEINIKNKEKSKSVWQDVTEEYMNILYAAAAS